MSMYNNYDMPPWMYGMYANSHFKNREEEPTLIKAMKIMERLERKEIKKRFIKEEEEKKKKAVLQSPLKFSQVQWTLIFFCTGPLLAAGYIQLMAYSMINMAKVLQPLIK